MRSTPFPAGNVKMKGKKTKSLSCGCCQAENFKFSEQVKQALKEVRSFNIEKEKE